LSAIKRKSEKEAFNGFGVVFDFLSNFVFVSYSVVIKFVF